jgi:hypothetical protein
MTMPLLLLKNWKLLAGGLALAVLGFMLVLAKADARHWRAKSNGFESAFNLEVAKHAITRQSVATLEGVVAAKNAESQARADAFAKAQAQSVSDLAALNARWRAGEGVRARLQALVSNPPNEACRAPAALLDGLEGL